MADDVVDAFDKVGRIGHEPAEVARFAVRENRRWPSLLGRLDDQMQVRMLLRLLNYDERFSPRLRHRRDHAADTVSPLR